MLRLERIGILEQGRERVAHGADVVDAARTDVQAPDAVAVDALGRLDAERLQDVHEAVLDDGQAGQLRRLRAEHGAQVSGGVVPLVVLERDVGLDDASTHPNFVRREPLPLGMGMSRTSPFY